MFGMVFATTSSESIYDNNSVQVTSFGAARNQHIKEDSPFVVAQSVSLRSNALQAKENQLRYLAYIDIMCSINPAKLKFGDKHHLICLPLL
jgi:hypothetical protein